MDLKLLVLPKSMITRTQTSPFSSPGSRPSSMTTTCPRLHRSWKGITSCTLSKVLRTLVYSSILGVSLRKTRFNKFSFSRTRLPSIVSQKQLSMRQHCGMRLFLWRKSGTRRVISKTVTKTPPFCKPTPMSESTRTSKYKSTVQDPSFMAPSTLPTRVRMLSFTPGSTN